MTKSKLEAPGQNSPGSRVGLVGQVGQKHEIPPTGDQGGTGGTSGTPLKGGDPSSPSDPAHFTLTATACERCVYWFGVDEDLNAEGECRRHAPRAAATARPSDEGDYVARWPITLAEEWCGEFRSVAKTSLTQASGVALIRQPELGPKPF